MRRRTQFRLVSLSATAALALLLLGVSGCVFSPPPCNDPLTCDGGTPPAYRPQNVANAYVAPLHNMIVAYAERGTDAADHYKEILDKDLFQFRYYDPQSSTPTIPKFWGYAEDVTTTTGLLTDPDVSKIELTFPLADTSGMVPSSVVGDPTGTMKITINGILLYVQKGDVLYQTTGSGDFYVAPIAGVYKLIRWEDNTAPPATSPRGVTGAGSGRLAVTRATTTQYAAPGSALLEAARRADLLKKG